MKTYKLKIDTNRNKLELNGNKMEGVTGIKVDIKSGKPHKVIIEMESEIVLEGTLLGKILETITCENCGRELGEFVGKYSVMCPSCNEINVKY